MFAFDLGMGIPKVPKDLKRNPADSKQIQASPLLVRVLGLIFFWGEGRGVKGLQKVPGQTTSGRSG